MSERQPPVQAVQCPKCGSPVEAGRPGAITSCSYCGSPLQLSVGASGHPIARLANIETSTVYLARTEALKRVREQFAEAELRLVAMREAHDAKQRQVEERQKATGGLYLWGIVLIILSVLLVASGLPICLIGLLTGIVLIISAASKSSAAKKPTAPINQELAQIVERGQQARAERDRLAARAAELEAGLDEMAGQL